MMLRNFEDSAWSGYRVSSKKRGVPMFNGGYSVSGGKITPFMNSIFQRGKQVAGRFWGFIKPSVKKILNVGIGALNKEANELIHNVSDSLRKTGRETLDPFQLGSVSDQVINKGEQKGKQLTDSLLNKLTKKVEGLGIQKTKKRKLRSVKLRNILK